MLEKTILIIKPDAVERDLVKEILESITNKGLRLVRLKRAVLEEDVLREHYAHVEEAVAKKGIPEVFDSIIKYMSSGESVICQLEGVDAVNVLREFCGPTDPGRANRFTIRGKYGEDCSQKADKERRAVKNIVHSSDSVESAEAEKVRFFGKY